MSRAAASQERKADQKVLIAAKAAEHAADLAMGITATMAKLMKADTLLCTVCGATQLGGVASVCTCPGGRSKPSADFCPKLLLLNAAKARGAAARVEDMRAHAKSQADVQAARSKKKEGAGLVDLQAELQGDGNELIVLTSFPIGPLGMSIEGCSVVSVKEGEAADQAKVKRGWVIFSVEGGERLNVAENDTNKVTKSILNAFKAARSEGQGEIGIKF